MSSARLAGTAPVAAVQRPELADAAYAALARAIAVGELPAGAEINERRLAEQLGMSRTPLREALHRLSLEGLVTRLPQRGTTVTRLDAADIRDNMAVREAIELEMAARVIEAGATLDSEVVAELLNRQREAVNRCDSRAFLEADEQFHLYLVAASGNPRALEAVRRTWLHVNRARYLAPMTVGHMRRSLADHRRIAQALDARREAEVRAAIRAHLEEPLARNLEALAAQRPAAFTRTRVDGGNGGPPRLPDLDGFGSVEVRHLDGAARAARRSVTAGGQR